MEFPTTHWSNLAVASANGATVSREALDQFCRRYRPAILGFVRWADRSGEDPEDVTQQFFLRLLESRAWKRADRTQGRFRSFLLKALKHHLIDLRRRRTAEKRGAGNACVPWDELGGEEAPPEPAAEAAQAELLFDRDWAVTMVDNALEEVANAMERCGQGLRFHRLAVYLQAHAEPPPYEQLAPALGLSVGGVKTEVHRLRKRFREALRLEVARTVAAPHEIDDELAYLGEVLSASDAPPAAAPAAPSNPLGSRHGYPV